MRDDGHDRVTDGYNASSDNDANVAADGCDKPRSDNDNNADTNNELGAADNADGLAMDSEAPLLLRFESLPLVLIVVRDDVRTAFGSAYRSRYTKLRRMLCR